MHAGALSINGYFKAHSISRCADKLPLHRFALICNFTQVVKNIWLRFMPQYGFAKHKSERHLVDQGLQRACRAFTLRKIDVRPSPEVAMTVPAIMALDAEPQRIC